MEPQNGGLEGDFPFQRWFFQVQRVSFRVSTRKNPPLKHPSSSTLNSGEPTPTRQPWTMKYSGWLMIFMAYEIIPIIYIYILYIYICNWVGNFCPPQKKNSKWPGSTSHRWWTSCRSPVLWSSASQSRWNPRSWTPRFPWRRAPDGKKNKNTERGPRNTTKSKRFGRNIEIFRGFPEGF